MGLFSLLLKPTWTCVGLYDVHLSWCAWIHDILSLKSEGNKCFHTKHYSCKQSFRESSRYNISINCVFLIMFYRSICLIRRISWIQINQCSMLNTIHSFCVSSTHSWHFNVMVIMVNRWPYILSSHFTKIFCLLNGMRFYWVILSAE